MSDCIHVYRVKLRIKTDCQQFQMKDDNNNNNNNEEANNIDLEPVLSPSKENVSQDVTTQQQDEVDHHSVSIFLFKKVRFGSTFLFTQSS